MEKILHLGFGYSMVLNNFYKVVSETPGRAKIYQVGSRTVEGDGWQGREVPSEADSSVRDNVNFKDAEGKPKVFTVVRRVKPDGTIEYRGRLDFGSVYTLTEVKEGQSFYFDHLD